MRVGFVCVFILLQIASLGRVGAVRSASAIIRAFLGGGQAVPLGAL